MGGLFDEKEEGINMKECDNLKKNLANCNCTYEPCSRKGRCCECLSYHWSSKELPGPTDPFLGPVFSPKRWREPMTGL
jgi:hypothetical protein